MENFEYTMTKWGTLALKFFNSAAFQAKRIVQSGNPNVIISDKEMSIEEYDIATEANDRNLAIPVIYNFYHGVELLLKGALLADGKLQKKDHNLDNLYSSFCKEFPNEQDMIDEFGKVIIPSSMEKDDPVRRFCEVNKLTPAKFYEALRYPENRSGDDFIHSGLSYNEGVGADYFDRLSKSIDALRIAYIALARSRK